MPNDCANDDIVGMFGGPEVLTPAEMRDADRQAIIAGVPGWRLMRAAGKAVAEAAMRHCASGARVLVLAGHGNNGGDGYVAAERLRRAGFSVRLLHLGERSGLAGDAAIASRHYEGEAEPLAADSDLKADLVVDALFGAGLARDLEGTAAEIVARLNRTGARVIAVDLPSGIDGLTGRVRGAAVRAQETITFFRLKQGHLLLPGRAHCGRIKVVDIGIGQEALKAIRPRLLMNAPGLWAASLPLPRIAGHKYDRGHCVIVSGPGTRTGAARLAAAAALRAGAGLVTMAAPPDAVAVHAAHLTAIMLHCFNGAADLAGMLSDRRLNAVAIGPGAGIDQPTRDAVAALLESPAAIVLDADAISAFADDPAHLFATIAARAGPVVLTPHDGEFARLFPDLAGEPDKVARTRAAAERSGATIILKGGDTTIAARDGEASINAHTTPWLATAGAGDVLTGIVAGLLAQRMEPFAAASAAVWMHGAAGLAAGPGLIAEDLPDALRTVWRDLAESSGQAC